MRTALGIRINLLKTSATVDGSALWVTYTPSLKVM